MNSFEQEYADLLKKTTISEKDNFSTKYAPLAKLIQDNAPEALFRFRACNDNNIDAFKKNQIFHSIPENFNDPHDSLVYFNKEKIKKDIDKQVSIEKILYWWPLIPKKIIKRLGLPQELEDVLTGKIKFDVQKASTQYPSLIPSAKSFFNITADDLTNTIKNKLRTKPKIACFSSDIMSTLMWSHYADSHKGFALGYDFATLKSKCASCKNSCNDYNGIHLMPIVYSDERYDATVLSGAFYPTAITEKLNLPPVFEIEIPDQLGFQKANLYKGKMWQYENEWRSFLLSKNPNVNSVSIIPTSLYLGSQIHSDHEKELIQSAYENGIQKIYKMKVIDDTKGFVLDIDNIFISE